MFLCIGRSKYRKVCMPVNRIQFGESLLKNKNIKPVEVSSPDKNDAVSNVSINTTQTESPKQVEETQAQEMAVTNTSKKESSTTPKVIGITAGLALITLGLVVAGCKGKLPKTIQKWVGGAKKVARHKTAAISQSGKKLTPAQMADIDKTLDRILPVIKKELLSIKVPTLDEVKIKGFDLSKFEMSSEPYSSVRKTIGDNKYFLDYGKDGKLEFIYQGPKDAKTINDCNEYVKLSSDGKIRCYSSTETELWDTDCYYNPDGTLDFASKRIDKNLYGYDEKGLLRELSITDKDDCVLKNIEYVHGTDKPTKVTYGSYSSDSPNSAKKIEIFDGHEQPVKEIYVKDNELYEIACNN